MIDNDNSDQPNNRNRIPAAYAINLRRWFSQNEEGAKKR